MDAHETHETPSPASSITKLGIVRFVLPDDPPSSGGHVPDGNVDLPTYVNDAISRPTVEEPPLPQRRDAAAPTPIYDYDYADDDDVLEPEPGPAPCASDQQRARTSTLPGVAPFLAAAAR
jgi:hypothetical protein